MHLAPHGSHYCHRLLRKGAIQAACCPPQQSCTSKGCMRSEVDKGHETCSGPCVQGRSTYFGMPLPRMCMTPVLPSVVAQRLWLCGDARVRPGVSGLGRCVRLEPNGDAVRWVTDTSCEGEPAQDAEAMVAAAAKLDLVANEFCRGVHGMLTCTRITVRGPSLLGRTLS